MNLAERAIEPAPPPAAQAEAAPLAPAGPPARHPPREQPAPKPWLQRNLPQVRALALAVLSLLLFAALWHVLTENRVSFHVRFINVPSPKQVLEKAEAAFKSAAFFEHARISCRRIGLGFIIAAVIAIPAGLLMGRYRLVRELVAPIVEVIRPIPAIAWVPMSIMLWPSNEESIVFITFLGSFFPILLNTIAGMSAVDPVLVRAAQSLGASERQIFRKVYFPACLPSIFTGLAIGMGVAWVSLIAAEMISGQFGIGYFTWEAYSLVQYADIALGMITIGVLGLLSSLLIRLLGSLLMPWRS
ncbi:MAG: ABC transporter permease [Hyphomicrobiaceae bacterium]|nr:ABC transporter permease [Hyphomicrobiaceae bacterium]